MASRPSASPNSRCMATAGSSAAEAAGRGPRRWTTPPSSERCWSIAAASVPTPPMRAPASTIGASRSWRRRIPSTSSGQCPQGDDERADELDGRGSSPSRDQGPGDRQARRRAARRAGSTPAVAGRTRAKAAPWRLRPRPGRQDRRPSSSPPQWTPLLHPSARLLPPPRRWCQPHRSPCVPRPRRPTSCVPRPRRPDSCVPRPRRPSRHQSARRVVGRAPQLVASRHPSRAHHSLRRISAGASRGSTAGRNERQDDGDGGNGDGDSDDRGDRHVDLEQDVDRAGDRQPQRPADDQACGDAGGHGDGGDGGGLPAHRRRRLTGTQAERPQHAEVASPATHGQHKGVGNGDEPEAHHGEPDGHRYEPQTFSALTSVGTYRRSASTPISANSEATASASASSANCRSRSLVRSTGAAS